MQNIKQKVLGLLQNEQNAEPVLNDLSNCQDNLLKNFLKPVFNKEDKNEILKQYNNLNSLGKNLYRYNNAKENNNNVAAEKNKQDAENILLKGGISYNRYIWHSENGEHTCDECRALDGKIFDFYEEVPDPPHPNCKCWVEIIENKKEKADDTEIEEKLNKKIYQSSTKDLTDFQILQEEQIKTSPQQVQDNTNMQQEPKWIKPVRNNYKISSGYGNRMHPVYNKIIFHDGIDIAVPMNTPIYAVADGTVSFAGWINGYGNYVQIEHSNGISSFYAHLNKIEVTKGDVIKQGGSIAKSGNTGIGTGAHLHFGMKKNGKTANPLDFLPKFE